MDEAQVRMEYDRLDGWRARWLALANNRDRCRKKWSLQRHQDYIIRRSEIANNKLAKLLHAWWKWQDTHKDAAASIPEDQALIHHRIECVEGPFDMRTDKMVCVISRKHRTVELCLDAGMNIPIANIELYSKDLAVDAEAVLNDAYRFGCEVARRWNAHITKSS